MSTKRERCTKRVFSGARSDFGGHPCSNYAKEDGLCGLHLAQLRPKVDATRPATVDPEVTTRTVTSVALTWPKGEGPVFSPPYQDSYAVWGTLRATVEDGELSRYLEGSGYLLKKDGTPGERGCDLKFAKLDQIPSQVEVIIRRAVAQTGVLT